MKDPELFKAICMGHQIDLSENVKREQKETNDLSSDSLKVV